MKKTILFFILVIILSSKMFAGIVLKECISGFGLYHKTIQDPFFEEECYSTNEF